MTGATRVTWLGHSTVLIETATAAVLTDPLLRDRVFHLRRLAAVPELDTPVDIVLISHVHWDHLHLRSLALLPRDVLFIVPRGAGKLLRKRGFVNVMELAADERVTVGEVAIRATEAVHPVERWTRGGAAPALGFIVEEQHVVYFAGDTDLFDGMGSLSAHLDLALLPIAGWGPRLPPGHLDPARAAQALSLLQPAVAVPIHWGTFAPIGTRRRDRTAPSAEFKRLALSVAPSVEVRVLDVGESTEIT